MMEYDLDLCMYVCIYIYIYLQWELMQNRRNAMISGFVQKQCVRETCYPLSIDKLVIIKLIGIAYCQTDPKDCVLTCT